MGHKPRGKGEGSIYQRGDGYWVGSVEAGLYPNGTRRKARVVRAKRTDVVKALGELRRQIEDGYVPDRTSTVAAFLQFWIDEVASTHVAASSVTEYRKRVKRLVPHLGKVKLHRLTAGHVQRAVNKLTEDYSTKTTRTTVETLRSALRWAQHSGLIVRNPAEGIKVRSVPTAKVDDTLTAEQARLVIDQAAGTDLHALVFLALTYGLRIGELLALRWADVDLDAGTLSVAKAKTRAGERTLPLTDEATDVLRAHRRSTPIGPMVFPGRSPQRTRTRWSDLLAEAGIEHLCSACGTDRKCSSSVRRFHSSRHTAATLLLAQGVPLEVVSSILGHSNIGVTSDIYARVRADAMRRALVRRDGTTSM